MQFSTTLKALVFATACLIPSIAAGPTLADSGSLAKKEDCCDPNFFYPCLAAENLGCTPDSEISTSAPTSLSRIASRFASASLEQLPHFAL
ncbi:hypothetical protein R3P38DRAFT_3070756, partial [Favolaschia claudopus]